MDMNAKREFLLTELERMLRSGIQSGDVVSVEVKKIGKLSNYVI